MCEGCPERDVHARPGCTPCSGNRSACWDLTPWGLGQRGGKVAPAAGPWRDRSRCGQAFADTLGSSVARVADDETVQSGSAERGGTGGGQESCFLSPPRTPCRLPDPEHTWRTSWVVSPGRGAVPRTLMLVSPPRGTGRWARVSASDPSSKVWELPLQVRGGQVLPYTEPDPAFAPGLHVCP